MKFTKEEALKYAKQNYPVGTKFKCINGNTDTGIKNSIFTVKKDLHDIAIYNQWSNGSIHSGNGWIYLDGIWAEIISNNKKQLQKNILYEIY